MTTQLEKVFTELQQLPEAEQNAVAQLMEDELLWKAAKSVNMEKIKSEQDYELSLDRVDAIFDAKPGTLEGDELALLLQSIEVYEDENHSVL